MVKIENMHIGLKLVITTIIVSLIGLAIPFISSPLFELLSCGNGMDGIGCVMAAAYLIVFLVEVVSTLTGIVILRFLSVRYALWIGLYAGIISYTSRFFPREISSKLAPNWPLSSLFYLIGLCIGYIIFSRPSLKLLSKLGMAAFITTVAYLVLPHFGNHLVIQNDLNQEQAETENIIKRTQYDDKDGFLIYMPTYISPPYRFYENTLIPSLGGAPPSYEISYLDKNDTPERLPGYTIRLFAKRSDFTPPDNCGPAENFNLPDEPKNPCQFITKLTNGSDLYYSHPNYTNMHDYYVLMGNTEIILGTTEGGISTEEAIKIFNSLQKKSAQELRLLQEQRQN